MHAGFKRTLALAVPLLAATAAGPLLAATAAGPLLAATAAGAPSSPAFATSALRPLAAAAPQDADSPKGVHQDSYFGFAFKPPKKWNNVPRKTKEQWLAAKYVSKTSYSYTDKDGTGWTVNHKPELQVIVFPLEVMKGTGVQKDEKEVDGEKVTTIKITSPYRDYDNFLERTFQGGGYYLNSEEEDEIDGVKVTKYTYLVNKLASSGPQTIETWVYHTEDVDYAVQLVGLTKHWAKIQKDFKSVRRTFELIERSGTLDHSGDTSDGFVFSRINLKDQTPAERKSVAVASESSIHEAAIAKLPPEGWTAMKSKRALMITSADKKYSKRVQNHVNNMFNWLDKEYGFLGEEAYLRAPVVRICANQDEAAAFSAGVSSGGYGGFWLLSEELLTWDDTSGWTGYAIDNLNTQIYRYWMLEKNFALSTAMPSWIDSGLSSMLENSRMDSRKPDWRFQNYTVDRFRTAVRDGTVTPARDVFLRTTKQLRSSSDFDSFAESAMLINYLASPDMRRHKLAKGLLKTYLTNMMSVVADIEKESEKALAAALKKSADDDEDGEKIYREERRKIFEEKEMQVLQKTFDLTFGTWTSNDWEKFEASYFNAY